MMKEEDYEKDWIKIKRQAQLNNPTCAGTHNSPEVDWEEKKLVSGHAYTLVTIL